MPTLIHVHNDRTKFANYLVRRCCGLASVDWKCGSSGTLAETFSPPERVGLAFDTVNAQSRDMRDGTKRRVGGEEETICLCSAL